MKHLIRILYSDYRISLEVFHSVTDGKGATLFLNSLVARYFEILGISLTNDGSFLNCKDVPSSEEIEDSFSANATNVKGNSHKEKVAYNIMGTIEEEGIVNTTNAIMNADEVKALAKK